MKDLFQRPSLVAKIAIGAFLALFVAGVVNGARAEGPVASFYIGAHAGASLANTALNVPGGSLVDGLGAESKEPVFGARTGMDLQLPGSVVFLGPFATYTVQDVKFSAIGGAFNASLKNSWSVGGRAGVTMGNAKPYVLAAYRQTDMEWTNLGPGFPAAPTLKGYDLGAGISYAIDKNLDLGIEGIWTKYQGHDPCGGCGLSLETDQLSVMAFLNFKIGGPEEAKPAASTKAKKIAP